jgi:hypothetical protein
MLLKIIAGVALVLLFMAVLYRHARRRPERCDGECGSCGDVSTCPREQKLLDGDFRRHVPPPGRSEER